MDTPTTEVTTPGLSPELEYCRISKVLHFDRKKLPPLRVFPSWVVSEGQKKRKKEEPGGLGRGLLP